MEVTKLGGGEGDVGVWRHGGRDSWWWWWWWGASVFRRSVAKELIDGQLIVWIDVDVNGVETLVLVAELLFGITGCFEVGVEILNG